MKTFTTPEIVSLNIEETANGFLPGIIEICRLFNDDLLNGCGCSKGNDDDKKEGETTPESNS